MLKMKEVAQLLNVSEMTITRLINAGKLHPIRVKDGGYYHYEFNIDEVNEFEKTYVKRPGRKKKVLEPVEVEAKIPNVGIKEFTISGQEIIKPYEEETNDIKPLARRFMVDQKKVVKKTVEVEVEVDISYEDVVNYCKKMSDKQWYEFVKFIMKDK